MSAGPGEGVPPTAGVGVLLAARFALEVLLLAAYAVIGTGLAAGWLGWALALVLVLLVAGVWGTWLAPKRRIDAPPSVRVVLELALFLGAGIGLGLVGHPQWGVILVAAEVVVLVLLRGPDRHAL